MRILDKNDIELQESEIDYEIGYLKEEEIIIEHHDAVQGQEEIYKYWPQRYSFTDKTIYTVTGFDDPHVIEVEHEGEDSSFYWKNLDGEEEKEVFGISVVPYIVQEGILARDAWDEYETILRYIEYTQEELKERAAAKAKEEAAAEFIENGPALLEEVSEGLEETNTTLDDLILVMADIIGN